MSHFVIKCNELLRYCYKPKRKKKKKGAKDVYLLKKQGISKRCFIISSAHVRCGSFISVFTGLHNQGELNTIFCYDFRFPYRMICILYSTWSLQWRHKRNPQIFVESWRKNNEWIIERYQFYLYHFKVRMCLASWNNLPVCTLSGWTIKVFWRYVEIEAFVTQLAWRFNMSKQLYWSIVGSTWK